ncbi:MAG: hypothetical protein KDA45_07460, partial [Planctomycetales bacterium]|nr:hypothetical protein [Planctomycetales bacterium]
SVIADQLNSMGAETVDSIGETLLIRDGLFCGRKFQCAGYEVVWFVEEDEIKFFSPCGELLKAVSALAAIREYEERHDDYPQRRVA